MELCIVNKQTLVDIANAIRTKNGKEDLYFPNKMPEAISAIITELHDLLNYFVDNSGKPPQDLIGEDGNILITDIIAYIKVDGTWNQIGVDLFKTNVANQALIPLEYILPEGYLELPQLITVTNPTSYVYGETTSYTNPDASKFGQGYVDSTTTTTSTTYRNCVMKITFKGYEEFPVAIHNYGNQTTSTYSQVFLSLLDASTYPTAATSSLQTVSISTVTSPNENTYTTYTFEDLDPNTEYTIYINHRYRALRNGRSSSTYSVVWLPIIGTYVTRTV